MQNTSNRALGRIPKPKKPCAQRKRIKKERKKEYLHYVQIPPIIEGSNRVYETHQRWQQCINVKIGNESRLFPVPNLRQEIGHIDLFVFHLHYPWVIQHPPGTGSSGSILLETMNCQNSYHPLTLSSTYQHAMKYFMLSLHLIPSSGSSFNSGIGCLTMYVSRSMSPARACPPLSSD